MKIVFYTSAGFECNEVFRYLFAHVAAAFPDAHIVAVSPQHRAPRAATLKRHWRKVRRVGVLETLEVLSGQPLQRAFQGRDHDAVQARMKALPRPAVDLQAAPVTRVATLNGADAVAALRALAPDIIIQAGAGILKKPVFEVARLGTLNLHHGIAPLIKGMNSIYWALWERKPEWIGSTVHFIDEGIDTGSVLAYAPVAPREVGEGFAPLFVQATQDGVTRLVETLGRLERGEAWACEVPQGAQVYRSTFSGWKLWRLEQRLARERRAAGPVPGV